MTLLLSLPNNPYTTLFICTCTVRLERLVGLLISFIFMFSLRFFKVLFEVRQFFVFFVKNLPQQSSTTTKIEKETKTSQKTTESHRQERSKKKVKRVVPTKRHYQHTAKTTHIKVSATKSIEDYLKNNHPPFQENSFSPPPQNKPDVKEDTPYPNQQPSSDSKEERSYTGQQHGTENNTHSHTKQTVDSKSPPNSTNTHYKNTFTENTTSNHSNPGGDPNDGGDKDSDDRNPRRPYYYSSPFFTSFRALFWWYVSVVRIWLITVLGPYASIIRYLFGNRLFTLIFFDARIDVRRYWNSITDDRVWWIELVNYVTTNLPDLLLHYFQAALWGLPAAALSFWIWREYVNLRRTFIVPLTPINHPLFRFLHTRGYERLLSYPRPTSFFINNRYSERLMVRTRDFLVNQAIRRNRTIRQFYDNQHHPLTRFVVFLFRRGGPR